MINRAAVVVRLKEPFVAWINEAEPEDDRPPISLEEVNDDRTVYLIDEDEAEHLDTWLALNFRQVFECELEDWTTNPDVWPKDINLDLFHDWCEVECHSVIVDTVGEPIEDDE